MSTDHRKALSLGIVGGIGKTKNTEFKLDVLLTAWYSVCFLFSGCWCLVPATQTRISLERENRCMFWAH